MLVELLEECECSLESPLGEASFEFEVDEECSWVVVDGATAAGATTTGTGAMTTAGAAITIGAGASAGVVVVVWLVVFELEVSVVSVAANPTPANSTAIPRDRAAVLSECFTIISP